MVKPWQRETKPSRRIAPEPLARDRLPEARQRGETLAAYRAFRAYLAHGSIRCAANALGTYKSTLERWSKRWRWPERKGLVLRRAAGRFGDLSEYEEKHGLPAARDGEELLGREMRTLIEITGPKRDAEMEAMMQQIRENMPDLNALLR